MAIDKEILKWLTGTPASDLNFVTQLKSADKSTIMAAIVAVKDLPETKTKLTALRRQLDKLMDREEVTMKDKKPLDVDSNTALTIIQEEQNMERLRLEQQEARERLIAQSYEMAGQIRTIKMISEFGDVTKLVWLKQVKESKIYRDLPNIGTWEEYCKYVGVDRHTTDQDLLNIATFGETFLAAVTSLNIGYRDLRKLRQLSHDGTITIDADAVQINGERIPLDQDHKEDLQTAIEQIIEEQARVKEELTAQKKAYERVQENTHKGMTRMQKDLDKFAAIAKAKGLTADEDAFYQQIEKHRILVQGSLIALEPLELVTAGMELTPRMKSKAIATVHELKMQILALYDTVITEIGDATICPEMLEDFDKWEQENGFK